MTDAPIELADYDPAWPAEFERERARLGEVLAPWLAGPVVHIGSTSVPGMIAKPVIVDEAAVTEERHERGEWAHVHPRSAQ